MEGGHQIKDSWAVGWRQEGRRGNHWGPEAVHRQEVICTKSGEQMSLQPKGRVLGLISPRAQVLWREEAKRRWPGAWPADTSLEILHIVFQCSRVLLRPGLTLHRGN